MKRSVRSFIGCLASLAFVGIGLSAAPQLASATVPNSTGVVINEVYGGGGNAGAPYTHDFIELYNTSGSAVSLAGWSLQYRASGNAGTAPFGNVNALSGTIQPNDYFLIQLASQAAVGDPLPTPDLIISTSPINLSGTAGVILLANTTTAQTCATGATACGALAATVDLVGFGSANTYIGSGPTPAPSNSTSVTRNPSGANTWSNAVDFTAGSPTPGAPAPPPPTDVGFRSIAQIQGTAATSPYAGNIATTTGIVTARYPTGGFNGYVIQTVGSGGGTVAGRTASDALFVFSSSTVGSTAIGDIVTVKGLVSEFSGLTQIAVASAADLTVLGTATLPAPIADAWPTTDVARETIESMLFTPTGTYTVSNTYTTNQYAEVGLAYGTTPLRTPTDAARPGTAAQAIAADNAARRVTLDDGASTNYLSAANQSLTPPYISLTNPLRVGANPAFATNVIVDYRNSAWKFQPLTAVTDTTASSFVTFNNNRTMGPDAASLGAGEVKVASFNVLNYFTTLGANVTGCTSYNDRAGNPITVNSCPGNGPRGAWNAANLARQQDKIVAAINALDADVVGLMEIENSLVVANDADAALSTLVDALNDDAGADTWAFVPSSAQLPAATEMDVISNAIIYKPASVARVGDSLALGTESGTGQAFDNAREPLGQVFQPLGGGDPFLFVVNHFKSKGSAGPWPGDADTGDGQGSSNESRIRQATALRNWVGSVQADAQVNDVFLVGDFNSYTFEDPLQVLYNAGYVDVNQQHGNTKQSYNFSGENGSLDHILANRSAWARVTGSDIWNINAPESIALEYSRYNYHGTLFYAPDAYRSSDHDPVIAAITAAAPAPSDDVELTLVSINDFHGRIDSNTLKWAATVEGIVASSNGNVAITAAGDLVSASLFASAVQQDQPTIDLMNQIGLEASAVGNHEFDKGWDDLRDRIIGGTGGHPRNAEWDYLGANVYLKGTQTPVLPEYAIITIDGIRVGVIGAVTEETPTLVSPAGIAALDFGDPVEAVNRVADQLTDGDDGNGEADVLIATFHEGAPTGSATLEANMAASAVFTNIVNGVSPKVDVLFNGHTHQAYVYTAPVPGGGTRPVLQTGSYGDFVGKVVLKVDRATKAVSVESAENVARSTTADADLLKQFPNLVEVKEIVDDALAYAAVVGNQPVGLITDDITTAYANGSFGPTGYQATRNNTNRDQRNLESTLGGLVANALYETLDPLGVNLPTDVATIGVVNPGGLRSELFYPTSMPLNEGDGVVTFAEANSVLPFVNNLWTTHLTGAQVRTMLEQQWQTDANGNTPTRAYLQLGLSDNASYTFDPTAPAGSRITSITVDGQPVDPAATYKIATFSFLTAGGDNFRIFTQGTSAADSGLVDRDAWIAYLRDRADPPGIAPDYQRRSAALTPLPTAVTQGGSLQTTLSYLDMTSLGVPQNTSIDVAIGGVSLGSVPVTFSAASNGNAAPSVGTSGSASVALTVPFDVPAGSQTLTFTVQPSGKVISVPITVEGGSGEGTVVPLAPSRILDTRTGGTTGDHQFEGIGIRTAGTTLELQVAGRGGVPADAIGAVLNITATDATGHGYVTVYPCGETRPEASSLNFDVGAPAPNTVLAKIGADGKVCLYTALASVHLIADVNGQVPADSDYLPLNPARLADSRAGAPTTDGQFSGGGVRTAGSVWEITVAGRGGVPADAETAALNITTTGASGTGYVTVWPCDATMPVASSVNFAAGQDVPNAVVTKLSATGTVCLFAGQAGAQLIVDVNGAFLPGSDYGALVPARLLDTRGNAPTTDGEFSGGGARQPGQVLELTVAGRGGVPDDATGVMLNITATDATGTGYVTAWPCTGTAPNASSLNYVAGTPRANASFMALSDEGTLCLVVQEAPAQLIVDVTGYL